MDKKDNYDPSLDHKEDDGAKQKSNVDVGSSGPAASESKVDCTASSADECPFSSDPFAKNYRCVLDLNDPKLLAAAKEFGLMPAQLEILQSAEWAERRRPFEQINVRLKVSCLWLIDSGKQAQQQTFLTSRASRNAVCWRNIRSLFSVKLCPEKENLSA